MSTTTVHRSPYRGAPPDRSLAQRLEALDRANAIRSERARIKRDLKGRRTTFAQALDHPAFANAKVLDLLVAVPAWGRVKASRALTRSKISHSKTCGGLTERQRTQLLAELDTRGAL